MSKHENNLRRDLLAEQHRYVKRFGFENGVTWHVAGHTVVEALELHADRQAVTIGELESEIADIERKLESLGIEADW